jgi:phage-related protein
VWVVSSRRDVREFPREVRRATSAELSTQRWRAVYTVRFAEAIYVLHAFQKKSKRSIATTKRDIELIRQRLAEAERLHRERQN